jgi:uracil-DNA glycosylase family 4
MDAFSALKLQIEWGADEALDAEPVDRLRPPVASQAATASPAVAASPAASPPLTLPSPIAAPAAPRLTPAERAAQAAAGAQSLPELRTAIAQYDGCPLRDTATNLVFAEGDAAAGLLLIGEAPSADDDRSGRVLSGAVGGYLDAMLHSIGLERSRMLLAPLIPWRPPGDRPPSAVELATCLPFLFRLIALAAPRRLVLFGPLATRSVTAGATARRRGRVGWAEVAIPGLDAPLQVLASVSLPSLLRTPALRREAWADLRLLRRTLGPEITPK